MSMPHLWRWRSGDSIHAGQRLQCTRRVHADRRSNRRSRTVAQPPIHRHPHERRRTVSATTSKRRHFRARLCIARSLCAVPGGAIGTVACVVRGVRPAATVDMSGFCEQVLNRFAYWNHHEHRHEYTCTHESIQAAESPCHDSICTDYRLEGQATNQNETSSLDQPRQVPADSPCPDSAWVAG